MDINDTMDTRIVLSRYMGFWTVSQLSSPNVVAIIDIFWSIKINVPSRDYYTELTAPNFITTISTVVMGVTNPIARNTFVVGTFELVRRSRTCCEVHNVL